MRTVTPEQLRDAYECLYPEEHSENREDAARIYGNWLWRYEQNPISAIATQSYRGKATQSWAGKVTRALFRALGIEQPRTKRQMLEALAK